jgi:hypothetical protein
VHNIQTKIKLNYFRGVGDTISLLPGRELTPNVIYTIFTSESHTTESWQYDRCIWDEGNVKRLRHNNIRFYCLSAYVRSQEGVGEWSKAPLILNLGTR